MSPLPDVHSHLMLDRAGDCDTCLLPTAVRGTVKHLPAIKCRRQWQLKMKLKTLLMAARRKGSS